MKLIDYPRFVPVTGYEAAISAQVEALSCDPGVLAVYQIGGVSTPGISDIDLVVVTNDEHEITIDPNKFNDSTASYLFTHRLYAAPKSIFEMSHEFSFFHNYKLLHGVDVRKLEVLDNNNKRFIQRQLALQFLVKMYINLCVQKRFEIIKLRSLFLHINAIPYDFEFLEIEDEETLSLVRQGIELRNSWLKSDVKGHEVVKWFHKFFDRFEVFMRDLMRTHEFYYERSEFNISPSIKVKSAKEVGFDAKGVVFKNYLALPQALHLKILHRINNFVIEVPINTEYSTLLLRRFFSYNNEAQRYNSKFLPNFMPLTSSLKIDRSSE